MRDYRLSMIPIFSKMSKKDARFEPFKATVQKSDMKPLEKRGVSDFFRFLHFYILSDFRDMDYREKMM